VPLADGPLVRANIPRLDDLGSGSAGVVVAQVTAGRII
jgi:hypothetical protein